MIGPVTQSNATVRKVEYMIVRNLFLLVLTKRIQPPFFVFIIAKYGYEYNGGERSYFAYKCPKIIIANAPYEKAPCRKAGLHKTVSASKAIFLFNTAQYRYGRRQPYHSDFSCLEIKIFTFEVLCSFAIGIFRGSKE